MVSGNASGHSKAQLLQIPCGIFLVMMPIIVAIRIWARVSVGSWKGLGLDDWTILASMVSCYSHENADDKGVGLGLTCAGRCDYHDGIDDGGMRIWTGPAHFQLVGGEQGDRSEGSNF